MKKTFLFFFLLQIQTSFAQQKTDNLVIITLDGMRWQELFGGIDTVLVNDKRFTKDSSGLMTSFWDKDVSKRRTKLFSFIWTTLAPQGQVYGNRLFGNKVNVSNPYRFSYPGYNELFTGYPDTAVNSNNKVFNPNINVLEFINEQPGYKGRVAAFTSWDVFPYILNTKRSGLYVNSDMDTLKFNTPAFLLLNDMQFLTAKPLDLRLDILTYMSAREYLKMQKPKVLYIAFDETDDFAHEGMYDQYLKSAHAEDAMIADLWNTLQSISEYRNKTALIITCDHGRGDEVKTEWTSHGQNIAGADQIWMAFMGPGISKKGEVKQEMQIYQAQLAQTLAQLLGMNFKASHPIQKSISFIHAR
ncbi:MAG: alkaline phosphatase family protein [Flavisolibacter sp.]